MSAPISHADPLASRPERPARRAKVGGGPRSVYLSQATWEWLLAQRPSASATIERLVAEAQQVAP
jgi:hypothetical protein